MRFSSSFQHDENLTKTEARGFSSNGIPRAVTNTENLLPWGGSLGWPRDYLPKLAQEVA